MKTNPKTELGLVRDVLKLIDQGLTTEQILTLRDWRVDEFFSERDQVMKYRVRDAANYLVTSRIHRSREDAIEEAFYSPYRY